MAVLDDCPGLKTVIVVDRKPLREYDDDEEGPPKAITKYIEARSGAKFSISYTVTESFPCQDGVKVAVYVDGEPCAHITYPPKDLPGNHARRGNYFKKDDKLYRRGFRFAPLSIVEDMASSSDVKAFQEKVESTGCITITFQYVTDVYELPYIPSNSQDICLSALGDLPEKAMKGDARSHQAIFDAPKEIRERDGASCYRGKLVDNGPFATFHFKYRSKDALKALRIIPGDSKAVSQARARDLPLEERPEDELTPEELREALRRMRRKREAEARSIKQERDTEARVKRERNVEVEDQDDEVTVVKERQKRPRVDPNIIVLD